MISREPLLPGLRVLVVGTSGSGKSTFAEKLAREAKITHLELDQMNWRPGWYDRSTEEPEAFLADVAEATAASDWVLAGNYAMTRPTVLPRLTHVVWLDLSLWQVMTQVIHRSFQRASSGADVFPGCREDWSRWLEAEHPIRWALATHHARRPRYVALSAQIEERGGVVLRCRNRREAGAALQSLVALARSRTTA